MLKKTLIASGVLLICLGLLVGYLLVNNPSLNAVMYGEIYMNRTWLHDEFYEANLTFGSWSDKESNYVGDETYPSTRTLIITDSVEFDEIFIIFPTDVDFKTTMIVMHGFTTHLGSPYKIKSLFLAGKSLTINYNYSFSTNITASVPLTKWVIVVMNKLDIDDIEFVFVG